MDTEEIRLGDDWAARIAAALSEATVVIAVIGPHWLRLTDAHGRRRIDRPDDWVHREVLHALQQPVNLLPVLTLDTRIPSAEGLPEALGALSRLQALHLREESWEQDLGRLINRLESLGFEKTSASQIRYPTPHIRIRDLSHKELNEAMPGLPGWEVVLSDLPGQAPRQRAELHKTFEFVSFEAAVTFLTIASAHISEVDHHPRWENIWRTLDIWLSTWDIGHKISKLDVELALYFEALYREYGPGGS